MLTRNQVLEAIAFAIQDPTFNENSNKENTENWDSLGEITILETLSRLTERKSDQIHDLYLANSISELLLKLKEHGLVE